MANLRIGKFFLLSVILFLCIIQLATAALVLGAGMNITTVVNAGAQRPVHFPGQLHGQGTPQLLDRHTNAMDCGQFTWMGEDPPTGKLAAGLIGILCRFIPMLHLWGILVPVLVVSVFLAAYFYVCYQRMTQKQGEPLSPPFHEKHED